MRLFGGFRRPTPERLLYTDRAGKFVALEQVMVAGVDGSLRRRIPALTELMTRGRPDHSVHAAALLVAWGERDAYRTVIRWVREHEWPEYREPLARWPGAERARRHAAIADAVRIAGPMASARGVGSDRVALMWHLLREYRWVAAGSAIADALFADETLLGRTAELVGPAVDRCIRELAAGQGYGDLAMRTAALLGPLATVSDERAATAASVLLGLSPDDATAVEVARALRAGSGRHTRALLESLAMDGPDGARAVANASLRARPRETSYPRWFDAGGRLIGQVEEAGRLQVVVVDDVTGALVAATEPADAPTGLAEISEAEFRARLAGRRADLLRAWAERLCLARSQDVDGIAAALGVPIAPPPLGAVGAGWADRYTHGVGFRFPLETIWWPDLTARFGEGRELPRLHWDSPHVRSFEVSVPDARWRTLVFAQSIDPPAPDVSVTSLDLRIERPLTPATPPPPIPPGVASSPCPVCGKPNAADAVFCGWCGRFLEWYTGTAPPAT